EPDPSALGLAGRVDAVHGRGLSLRAAGDPGRDRGLPRGASRRGRIPRGRRSDPALGRAPSAGPALDGERSGRCTGPPPRRAPGPVLCDAGTAPVPARALPSPEPGALRRPAARGCPDPSRATHVPPPRACPLRTRRGRQAPGRRDGPEPGPAAGRERGGAQGHAPPRDGAYRGAGRAPPPGAVVAPEP